MDLGQEWGVVKSYLRFGIKLQFREVFRGGWELNKLKLVNVGFWGSVEFGNNF